MAHIGFGKNGNIDINNIVPEYYHCRMLLCWLILLLSATTSIAKNSNGLMGDGSCRICMVNRGVFIQDTTPHYKLRMTPNISPAQPPRRIQKWVINNIYFDTDKSDIGGDAAKELDKLATLLKQRTGARVEISGYTDARGSSQYNIALSRNRAEAAKGYLVSKGISADRILVKWYGETHLINQCADGVNCTEADHQLNRRVEFKVLNN